jgi:hypothetical protein
MNYKNIFIKKIGIGFIISLALIAAIILVQKDINARVSKIIEIKKEIKNSAASFSTLSVLSAQENKAKEYENQINYYYINKDQLFLGFFKDLSLIAGQNNITPQLTFGVETPSTDLVPRSMAISLSLSGKEALDSFKNFLTLLENSVYFVRFDSIDLNQSSNGFNANLSGQVFSF